MDYNLNIDRLRKEARDKLASISQGIQEKTDHLAPDTLKIRSKQMADLDSTLNIPDQGKFRVASEDKGYYPDAYETSDFRYVPQPEDPPEVRQRKAATLAAHQRSYARKYGLEPDEVTVKNLIDEGIRQKEKVLPEFAARGAQEGEEPVLTVQPHSPGESTYGRQLAEVTNPAGEELSKTLSTDPEQNANYKAAQNALGIFGGIARGNRQYKVGDRPKTFGEFFEDIGRQVVRGTASNVGKGLVETAGFLDPTNLVTAPFGGKGIIKAATQGLGINERIAKFDERTAEGMSAPERHGRAMFEKRWNAYLETRDRKKAELEKANLSETEIQADLLTDDLAYLGSDLWNNPMRVIDGIAQGVSSVIPIVAGGMGAGALKARSLVSKYGKEFLSTDAGRKALAKISGTTGISIGALQEGASASFDMEQRIRELPEEDISKSELYQKVLKNTGSAEKARDAVANQGSFIAFSTTVPLVAGSSMLLGLVGLSGSKALAQTGRAGRGPLGYRGTTRTAVEAGGKASAEGVEEGFQSAIQSILSDAQLSRITQKENPNRGAEAVREGVVGAVSGAGTGGLIGGQRQARTEIFGDRRTPTFSEKPQNKVTFRNPEQEEGVKPELKRILENVGMDIDVTSGYRSAGYNDKIGAVKGSRHVHGDAVDISLAGLDDTQKKTLLKRLYNNGITAAITYEGSDAIHIDMHKRGNQEFSLLHSPTGKGQDASFRHRASAPQWAQEAYAEIQAQGGNRASNIYTEERVVGRGKIPNTPYARDINQGIERAVVKHGLPSGAGEYLRAIVDIESSWGRRLVGKMIGSEISGAREQYGKRAQGPFQFMPDTAARYGLKDRNDPYASSDAAARMFADNYNRIIKNNPDISKEEALHRAAISHHSGPFQSYEALGKWGKDYDRKLRARVGRYGTADEETSVSLGDRIKAAKGLRDKFVNIGKEASGEATEEPTPSSKKVKKQSLDELTKFATELKKQVTDRGTGFSIGDVSDQLIDIEEEIEKRLAGKRGTSLNEEEVKKYEILKSFVGEQLDSLEEEAFGPTGEELVGKVAKTLGSSADLPGPPPQAEGPSFDDLPPPPSMAEGAQLVRQGRANLGGSVPPAPSEGLGPSVKTEKQKKTEEKLARAAAASPGPKVEADVGLVKTEEGRDYSEVLTNDELETLQYLIQRGRLTPAQKEILSKASDKVVPSAIKNHLLKIDPKSWGGGKELSRVAQEKLGFYSSRLKEDGTPKLGLAGHNAKIQGLLGKVLGDPTEARVGEIRNALTELNGFVQYIDADLANAETAHAQGQHTKGFMDAKRKEAALIKEVYDHLVGAYNESIPQLIRARINKGLPNPEIKKYSPPPAYKKGGQPTKEAAPRKEPSKEEAPSATQPAEVDLNQLRADEYEKFAKYAKELGSKEEAFRRVIAERTKKESPPEPKSEPPTEPVKDWEEVKKGLKEVADSIKETLDWVNSNVENGALTQLEEKKEALKDLYSKQKELTSGGLKTLDEQIKVAKLFGSDTTKLEDGKKRLTERGKDWLEKIDNALKKVDEKIELLKEIPKEIGGHTITFVAPNNNLLKLSDGSYAIAKATKEDKIYVSTGITTERVLDYIGGHGDTSEFGKAQKAVVTRYMQEVDGIDLVDAIKKMDDKQIKLFIVHHEISHVENKDKENYKSDPNQTIAGNLANPENTLLADSAIKIEARANKDALKALGLFKEPTQETKQGLDISEGRKPSVSDKNFAKDQAKAAAATKFIGVGLKGSSTNLYREAIKKNNPEALKGPYTKDDTVFISVNGGTHRDRVKYTRVRNQILEAVEAGAELIADNPENRDPVKRSYNTGERELADYLANTLGLEEYQKEGEPFSRWRKPTQEKPAGQQKKTAKEIIEESLQEDPVLGGDAWTLLSINPLIKKALREHYDRELKLGRGAIAGLWESLISVIYDNPESEKDVRKLLNDADKVKKWNEKNNYGFGKDQVEPPDNWREIITQELGEGLPLYVDDTADRIEAIHQKYEGKPVEQQTEETPPSGTQAESTAPTRPDIRAATIELNGKTVVAVDAYKDVDNTLADLAAILESLNNCSK